MGLDLAGCPELTGYATATSFVWGSRVISFGIYPTKHNPLTHFWFYAGLASATPVQHYTNSGSRSRVCYDPGRENTGWSPELDDSISTSQNRRSRNFQSPKLPFSMLFRWLTSPDVHTSSCDWLVWVQWGRAVREVAKFANKIHIHRPIYESMHKFEHFDRWTLPEYISKV